MYTELIMIMRGFSSKIKYLNLHYLNLVQEMSIIYWVHLLISIQRVND